MTDWWEQPYKGGPMVPVPGFPRMLEVGDPDGPDVLAYKRTVSRAGRWKPWEPSTWDDTYEEAFAMGRGTGNVGDSGVRGVQRQQKLPETGVVDERTFNTLRSVRVPEGPHQGEMAMDANAANLIALAYDQFAKPPPKPTIRERALDAARGDVGYFEGPGNDTFYGRWYGMNYQPYCAMAVSYWYEVDAGGSPSFAQGAAFSYCPYILDTAQRGASGLSITTNPVPGDLVLYDWGYDGVPDHVGLFESGTASSFTTIEANTSSEGSGGSQSNGGGVYRRNRRSTDARITFVRVAEP